MQDLVIETMTLNQVVATKRELGLHSTPETEKAGIIQGVFPYGDHIERKQSVFVFYRKLFNQWVAERATDKDEQFS